MAHPIEIVTQVLPRTNLPLLAVFVLACSSPAEPLPVTPGRSDRPRGGPTVPAPPEVPPLLPWDRWPEVATFRLAVPRGPSQHLADHEAEILASPEATAYPDLGPAKLLPPGSALVERLYAPGAATPEVLFAMATPATPATPTGAAPSPAAWEFLVLTPEGKVEERGALGTCARCHAEAENDGVFGRAR